MKRLHFTQNLAVEDCVNKNASIVTHGSHKPNNISIFYLPSRRTQCKKVHCWRSDRRLSIMVSLLIPKLGASLLNIFPLLLWNFYQWKKFSNEDVTSSYWAILFHILPLTFHLSRNLKRTLPVISRFDWGLSY